MKGTYRKNTAFVTAGVATSIAFLGLADYFLLRKTWNPQGLQLIADVLMHHVMPTLFVLYWWFNFPKGALRWFHPVICVPRRASA
jgi:hypothetical protein